MAISLKFAKSSASTLAKLNKPLDRKVLERAEKLSWNYKIVIERDAASKSYFGNCVELPGAMGDGKSPDDCVESVRQAIISQIAFCIESKRAFPPPESAERRTEMVNVRLTPSEKRKLEQRAKAEGMAGISDYLRSAALVGDA